ncbi:MAG TPA: GNAT family N-acetyltransferase [Terriglobales bacterium]|nr:GNAT family N-acetyltransferase [Terriglobales bacterium]
MIRPCNASDFPEIYAIINDGASAYRGIIPADRWHEPYMPEHELRREIQDGIVFWGYEENATLAGVMGIQEVGDVTLIRHAYVRTSAQGKGIGGQLLAHLRAIARTPLLIGTWADATWAIRFYEKLEFQLVSGEQKDELLQKYWKIPQRQVETSVVLASSEWLRSAVNSQTSVQNP